MALPKLGIPILYRFYNRDNHLLGHCCFHRHTLRSLNFRCPTGCYYQGRY